MLLVLPPSRGQTSGPEGAPALDLDSLAFPELRTARATLLAALAGTANDPASTPTAPAAEVLTGVLYTAADLPGLLRRRTAAAGRTRDTVLIANPLLGMVTPLDRIPASRLAMGMVDGIGGLGPFWRRPVAAALDTRAAGRVVVDVRSSEFLPLWRPPSTSTWVSVRVVQESGGERRVVSHFAKHWRGMLVQHLLTRRGNEPTDLRSLVRAARGLVTSGAIQGVEHEHAPRPGSPATLTLVVA